MSNELQTTAPTPPDELVQQWRQQWNCRSHNVNSDLLHDFQQYLITQASQWVWEQRGAATEAELQQARDEALEAAQRFYAQGHDGCTDEEIKADFDAIRRALERLEELEAVDG